MVNSRAGLVLFHLTPEKACLPEYVAELGFDVAQATWGVGGWSPRVIVTDQPDQLAEFPELVTAIREGVSGLIVLSASTTPAANPVGGLAADYRLPEDATGRELVMAIELVGEVCEQRMRWQHEREECQRWIDLAMHDSLTGLPNRRCWDKQLAQDLATRKSLCIGLIDVDFFKQVNDRDGHKIGDSVLREAARAMRSQLRDNDFVARLGGDEFGVIIRQIDTAMAESIVDRLRRTVSSELALRGLPAPTLSAGLVIVQPHDARDAARVFGAAATSLQAAKHQSRNRTVTHKPALLAHRSNPI
jgi:diguanylate cyclase (GGDEF)-like protein